jgi:hypothetical protein
MKVYIDRDYGSANFELMVPKILPIDAFPEADIPEPLVKYALRLQRQYDILQKWLEVFYNRAHNY